MEVKVTETYIIGIKFDTADPGGITLDDIRLRVLDAISQSATKEYNEVKRRILERKLEATRDVGTIRSNPEDYG